jgi:glycosyltransferase involved in cell wall biosynthesis
VKVALAIGPCLPGECGVGDYTTCLATALTSLSADIHVITAGDWHFFGARKILTFFKQQKFDIVHLEYPTVGFGHQLGPQVVSLLHKSIVTIHEASQRHILRKISLLPFAVRPEHIIFTSVFEQQFVSQWLPWTARSSSVIPVGSNIPLVHSSGPRNLSEIVYFGLILPRKELDHVFALADLIRARNLSLVVRVIGHVSPKHQSFFQTLQARGATLPIVWDCNLSDHQIAERLAQASVAYLPYSDGASDRRTTLKTALQSGVAVVTTRGPHTTGDLAQLVKLAQDPQEALSVITSLLQDLNERLRLGQQAVHFAQSYSWERIAKRHLGVYDSVLRKRSSYHSARAENRNVLG